MDTLSMCRSHGVPVYSSNVRTLVPDYAAWWQKQMCVNDLCKVALDVSALAWIEPAISSRKYNAWFPAFRISCRKAVAVAVAVPFP